MPRNRVWTSEEISFLNGMIQQHGNFADWSEEAKGIAKARLADRTESGIYQQTLKMLKARKIEETMSENEAPKFFMTKGA